MKNKLRAIVFLCFIIPSLTIVSGCSVNKAMNQPNKKDVSVLDKGTPRYEVISEIGQPIDTKVTPEGNKIDVYSFIQGYSKAAKASRAFGHGLMDLFTLGLWEIAGTATEAAASGDKVVVRVHYDSSELIHRVEALKGADELN